MGYSKSRLFPAGPPVGAQRSPSTQARRNRRPSIFGSAALIASLLVGLATPAGALPPPPENPSDQQITASQAQATEINNAVGALSAQVAATQGEIERLNNDMELKAELAQKAAVDLDVAKADAAAAALAATAAAAAAAGAQTDIDNAQLKADNFAAASFRQGSTLGSMSALIDAGSTDELMQRQQLLASISGSQLDVIGGLQRARVAKSNLDAAARDALALAQSKQAAADQAKVDADAAQAAATTAFQVGQAQLATLQGQLDAQQIAYQAAVNTVDQLQGQRDAYNQWLVLKAAEEERLRQEAIAEAARQAAIAEAARVAAEQAAAAAAAAAAAQAEADRQAAAARAAADADAARQAARNAQAAANSNANSNNASNNTPAPVTNVSYNGDVGATVVAAAMQWLGTPYAWGGGTPSGPSRGVHDGGTADRFGDFNKVGFDCSGLALYAYAQAGIYLPHYSGYQYQTGARISKSNLQPGDLVFYANNTSDPNTIHHVAIYMGNGQMIEAPQSGSYVKVSAMRWSGYIGASRPGS